MGGRQAGRQACKRTQHVCVCARTHMQGRGGGGRKLVEREGEKLHSKREETKCGRKIIIGRDAFATTT